MKRFACVAAVCLVAILGIGARSAQAQVTPGAADPKMYVEFNFGPTLGHKSDAFVGGEFGYHLTPGLDLIVDISHMGNVGTTELDDHAAIIANFLGGSAAAAYKASTFAFGARYRIPVAAKVSPYVLAALGVAHVATDVQFTVNGTTIDPATRPDLQLGGDLSGSTNRTLLVIGFGVNYPFKQRFFGDLGYRYGQIFSKTLDNETLGSIPTQRIVLGVGVRF